MTETTPRREATRAKLIDAAIDEFAERGIDATSVEQLCDRAGFSRGAFYSNFATKDDLCIAMLESHREHTLSQLEQLVAQPEADQLDWLVDEALPGFFRLLAPNDAHRLTMMEIRLRATRSPELRERLAAFDLETRRIVEELLTEATAKFGVEPRLSSAQFFAVFEAVYFHPTCTASDPDLLPNLLTALIRRR